MSIFDQTNLDYLFVREIKGKGKLEARVLIALPKEYIHEQKRAINSLISKDKMIILPLLLKANKYNHRVCRSAGRGLF